MITPRLALLDSARRHAPSGEDRLTEIFATVLAGSPELAASLFAKVDPSLPTGERFLIAIEASVAPGARVDMTVQALGENGRPVAQIWSEHKTRSPFRPRQREDYADALDDDSVPGRLITITHQPRVDEHERWMALTWQDICGLAVGLLYGKYGAAWRTRALSSDAYASARLLYELLWYLDEEGFAVADALSHDDVSVFAGYASTRHVLHTLMAQACKYVEPLIPDRTIEEAEDGGAYWQLFERPAETWMPASDEYGGWPELMVCRDDGWVPDGDGAPAFGAGFSFEASFHRASSLDDAWASEIAHAGFTWEVWGGWLRCYRTMPLAAILKGDDTLDKQAETLGRWASKAIVDLDSLRPNAAVTQARSR